MDWTFGDEEDDDPSLNETLLQVSDEFELLMRHHPCGSDSFYNTEVLPVGQTHILYNCLRQPNYNCIVNWASGSTALVEEDASYRLRLTLSSVTARFHSLTKLYTDETYTSTVIMFL